MFSVDPMVAYALAIALVQMLALGLAMHDHFAMLRPLTWSRRSVQLYWSTWLAFAGLFGGALAGSL